MDIERAVADRRAHDPQFRIEPFGIVQALVREMRHAACATDSVCMKAEKSTLSSWSSVIRPSFTRHSLRTRAAGRPARRA